MLGIQSKGAFGEGGETADFWPGGRETSREWGGGPELLPPKEAAIWEGGNDGSLEKYISSYL